jgi:hypothetical protein
MINFSFEIFFLGISVTFGVLILYFLRNVKPEVARDEISFATLVYFTVVFDGSWLEIRSILLFSQVLIIM